MPKTLIMNTNTVQHISIEKLRQNPNILIDILESDSLSFLFAKKEGNEITLHQKQYNPQIRQILQQAENLAEQRNKAGETRQETFKQFTKIHNEICKTAE